MTNAHPSQNLALVPILMDRVDWIDDRLRHVGYRSHSPSSRAFRHRRQIAGVLHIWLTQGRHVELSGSLSDVREVCLALMAETAGIALPALCEPEMLTELQWSSLSSAIDEICKASLVFRATTGGLVVRSGPRNPRFFISSKGNHGRT